MQDHRNWQGILTKPFLIHQIFQQKCLFYYVAVQGYGKKVIHTKAYTTYAV
jgi:hypothetical protein